MQKLKTELWNHAVVGAGHAAYTDRKNKNGRENNKRTRIGNAFASTVNHVGRENTGAWPKCTTCNSYHAPGGPCRTCFNSNRLGHLAKDCRGVPRNVNPVNARNPTVRTCYECGSWKQGNQARGRAFILGAEEARQDPNIVTGIEPSELGFRYEIEIASGQLVEIDKDIKDFPKVFSDDLSRLPPVREIKFRIKLIPRVRPVAKSPYCLAPSELEELSGQLKELKDKENLVSGGTCASSILFVFNEGIDGLGEFFPDSLCIIDMGSIDNALKNLQHWSPWPFKP
nr:reverse transcriptase domain-containing protein [Tanacetum cinerariifolium]